MHEILAVALICAMGVSAQDCSRETALDIVSAPVSSQQECLMAGSVMASGLHLDEPEADGTRRYLKVACERRRTASAMVGVGR